MNEQMNQCCEAVGPRGQSASDSIMRPVTCQEIDVFIKRLGYTPESCSDTFHDARKALENMKNAILAQRARTLVCATDSLANALR